MEKSRLRQEGVDPGKVTNYQSSLKELSVMEKK